MCIFIFIRLRIPSQLIEPLPPRKRRNRILRDTIRAMLLEGQSSNLPLEYESIEEYEMEPPHLTDEALDEVNNTKDVDIDV
jgi:uroporphyrinogen-III synthase